MFAAYFEKRATSKLKKVNKLKSAMPRNFTKKQFSLFPLQKLENYHFETVGNAVG